MAYDIIEVTVAVDGDAAHQNGDVLFQMTEVPLPARACKVVDAYFEGEATPVQNNLLSLYFFKSNAGGELGPLNGAANITPANFALNKFIGSTQLLSDADAGLYELVPTMIVARRNNGVGADTGGGEGGGTSNLILKGDVDYNGSTQHGVYMSGFNAVGVPDFDSDKNCKVILHVEY
jgi:hypothetical protein|tara:strand:- start:1547 stop:2077 length:531 start_codon:yes stop_codon:yes gene_type:complete